MLNELGLFLIKTGLFFASLGFIAWLVRNGFRRIQAKPIHAAVPTFFGKPLWKKTPIGPRFKYFFLFPWVYGFLPFKVERISDISIVRAILPKDGKPVNFIYSYTVSPDKKNGSMLEAFNETGEEEGVRRNIKRELDSKAREYLSSADYGPQTIEEAEASPEESIAILFREFLDEGDLPRISFDKDHRDPVPYPTSALLKFFRLPQGRPNTIESEEFGEKWEKLNRKIKRLKKENPEKFEEMKAQVEERRKELKRVLSGLGTQKKKAWGVILNLIAIEQISLAKDEPSGVTFGTAKPSTDSFFPSAVEAKIKGKTESSKESEGYEFLPQNFGDTLIRWGRCGVNMIFAGLLILIFGASFPQYGEYGKYDSNLNLPPKNPSSTYEHTAINPKINPDTNDYCDFIGSLQDHAMLNIATNGCVSFELRGRDEFHLEFDPATPDYRFNPNGIKTYKKFDCHFYSLPNGAFAVEVICPGSDPIDIKRGELNRRLDEDKNCGFSPWRISGIGIAFCELRK